MDLQPQGLRQPLDTVPLEIGEWRGRDQEIEEDHRYGDEHVSRVYGRPGGQVLSMWAAYSTTAEDRKHHPDVCMAVAGLREETSERATFEIPGHEAPVQQYRFSGASGSVWVFYWHYTLPTPGEEGLDKWQALYRNLNHRPASVTLEVFAPATNTSDVEAAREFVRQLDGIAQEIVGPDAERGSDRKPVTVVPGG